MSAITGIFYRDGRKVEYDKIKKMNDRLSHRGPDGSKVWCEGSVGLGHQMLWTTPESLHEELPFEEDGLVITADARIDNRKELSEKLGVEDKEEVSDSYFILKAYQKWGEKCPEELLGDFAFAIWDKNEEKLFCARDHMGVKPFYYYLSDEMFVFGTEIKALFCVQEVPYKLNELKVAFHLLTIVTDRKFTFFENIFSLASAHSLTIKQDTKMVNKYWELDPDYKIVMNSDEDYRDAFCKIFEDAVACRLRSAFPIGFELSGGLDSSFVVGTAKKMMNKCDSTQTELNTFSMVFDDFPQVDERHYINKVVEMGGIKSHFIPSDKINPLSGMQSILWYQEQPFNTPNMAFLYNLYKKMRDVDIRVVLVGHGGDEIVSDGNRYHLDLAVNFQWKKLFQEISGFSKRYNTSFSKVFYKLVIMRLASKYLNTSSKRFFKLFTKSAKYDQYSCLNEEFVNQLGGKDYFQDLDLSYIMPKQTSRQLHYFMINEYFHQYTLEMLNKLASSVFIEPRYPYFDKRLVEFCYAIPDDLKMRCGWNRYIQRISMENMVPEDIQWRKLKINFNPVLETNLSQEKRLNEILTDNPLLEKYIDLETLNEFYTAYVSNNSNSMDLWLVLILYVWLEHNKMHSKKIN